MKSWMLEDLRPLSTHDSRLKPASPALSPLDGCGFAIPEREPRIIAAAQTPNWSIRLAEYACMAFVLLFRLLSLLQHEFGEYVADVEQFGIEQLHAGCVPVRWDALCRHRLGVMASKTIRKRVRRLGERLHGGAR